MSLPTPSAHLAVPPPPFPPSYAARPFILVPLYIYPAPDAWDPIYTAAALLADALDFYVVVNPGNGPGPDVLPDANYLVALERLTALGNVKVIGYVHCTYGTREADEIVRDVERYAAWEGESVKAGGMPIIVDGIFIDETPSSTEYVQYLAALANATKMILNRNSLDAAKLSALTKPDDDTTTTTTAPASTTTADEEDATTSDCIQTPTTTDDDDDDDDDNNPATTHTPNFPPSSSGALTPSLSSAVVIYNPGVVVDPIFYQAADYIVAFENTCAQWWGGAGGGAEAGAEARIDNTAALERRLPRPLVRRSIPCAHSARDAAEVARLARRAGDLGCLGVFVTSRPGYTEWCEGWEGFVAGVADRARGGVGV